jgi:hypothetical protein
MKRIIVVSILSIVLLFAISTVNNAFAGGAIKIGVDLEGDHDVSGLGESGSADVDMGFSLSAEFFGSIGDNVDIGGGLTWQLPRSQKDFEGDFYFIPLYGMVRVQSSSAKVAPYAVGQLGYNFFFGDDDYKGTGINAADLEGGLYYGIGGGIIINDKFQIEALYSVNNGSADILGYDFDIEYSTISIIFGFIF